MMINDELIDHSGRSKSSSASNLGPGSLPLGRCFSPDAYTLILSFLLCPGIINLV